MINYREDPELLSVLESASQDDLNILIDIITDSGKGRLSLNDSVMNDLIAAKEGSEYKHLLKIAGEIQRFGGNSIIGLFRQSGVEYKEVACDVADHYKVNYNKSQDISQIENAILMKVLEQSLEKMTDEERKLFFSEFGVDYAVGAMPIAIAALQFAIKSSGFFVYKMTAIIAQITAKAVLGRGLAFGATAGLMKGISVFSGPIGWAITAIWSAFDLASPAYRVTVPCTIQLAYIRQKAMINECSECKTTNFGEAKFCSNCGHDLAN